MPKFKIEDYFTKKQKASADENFVMPATLPDVKLDELARQYIATHGKVNSHEFAKQVLSIALGRSGLKQGITFGVDKSTKDTTTLGTYSESLARINIKKDVLKNRSPVLLAEIVAHETRHALQANLNRVAKYFTEYSGLQTNRYSAFLDRVLGIKIPQALYRLNYRESDAFASGLSFSRDFVQRAYEVAVASRDPEKINFALEQVKSLQSQINLYRNEEEYRQSSFGQDAFYALYNKSSAALEKYISLTKALDYGVELTDGQKESVYTIMHSPIRPSEDELINSATALAQTVALMPQREWVREVVNLASISNNAKTFNALTGAILENNVPITKQDFVQLALSRSLNEINFLPDYDVSVFSRIDERTLVSTLVATHGKNYAYSFISRLKDEDIKSPFNYELAVKTINETQTLNLKTPNGRPLSCFRQVYDYALAKHKGILNHSNIDEVRATALVNLSALMQGFNGVSYNSPKFLRALDSYIKDPFTAQVENKESFSEVSKTLYPPYAKTMAEFLKEHREQGDLYIPAKSATRPIFEETQANTEITIDFKEAFKGLNDALKNLANAINSLTESLKDPKERGAVLSRFGIKQVSDSKATISNTTGEIGNSPDAKIKQPEDTEDQEVDNLVKENVDVSPTEKETNSVSSKNNDNDKNKEAPTINSENAQSSEDKLNTNAGNKNSAGGAPEGEGEETDKDAFVADRSWCAEYILSLQERREQHIKSGTDKDMQKDEMILPENQNTHQPGLEQQGMQQPGLEQLSSPQQEGIASPILDTPQTFLPEPPIDLVP